MTAVTVGMRNPESETAQLGLRARKQRLTRDAIWNAAIDLFAEKGFDDTTIDEIAESAQVSRRSFFRYFESKSDLMAQPIGSMANSLAKAVESCPRSASAAELFRYVVSALCHESAEEPRTAKVMEIAARHPAARDALLSRMAGVQNQIEEAFRRRSKDALLVQVLSSLTLSALSLATRHWFANGQKDIAASTRKVFSTIADVAGGLNGQTRSGAGSLAATRAH
jgi:AcrR family transcriptional regulator